MRGRGRRDGSGDNRGGARQCSVGERKAEKPRVSGRTEGRDRKEKWRLCSVSGCQTDEEAARECSLLRLISLFSSASILRSVFEPGARIFAHQHPANTSNDEGFSSQVLNSEPFSIPRNFLGIFFSDKVVSSPQVVNSPRNGSRICPLRIMYSNILLRSSTNSRSC